MIKSLLNNFMIFVVMSVILLINNVSCQGSMDATNSGVLPNSGK